MAASPAAITRRDILRAAGGLAGLSLVAAVEGCDAVDSSQPQLKGDASTAYKSLVDFRPPPIAVDARRSGALSGVVLTDCHGGTGQQGPMIIGSDGSLVWFNPISDGGTPTRRAFNLRVQQYRGQPVLTWFEGAVVDGHGAGHYNITDTSYRQLATVEAANGLQGDLHEFFLTDAGTAVFSAYGTAQSDLSAFGGARKGLYFYCEIQEVDVETGKLVFSWRSDEHIGFDESFVPAPTSRLSAWDYMHLNSINIDPSDGNLVVSGRNCFAFYKVNRRTGALMWRLGGKRNDFATTAADHFAYQHHVTPHLGGIYTLFDNEGAPWVDPPSRGLALQVDETHRTASLVDQYHHTPSVKSGSLGSVQQLEAGHTFVGWGTSTFFTEYGTSGEVLFDGRLVGGLLSYRAFKQAWSGQPAEPPALVVESSGGTARAYASWNGATETAAWRLLGSRSIGSLLKIGTVPRAGFETRLTLPSGITAAAVEALGSSGAVLGRSPTRHAPAAGVESSWI
ncbi:MAG: arylsulfotransferase family protein [Acidimicrobiales bacterium]